MAEDETARAVGIDIIKGTVSGAVAAAATGDPMAIVTGAAFGALGGGGAEMMARAIASFRPGNDAGFHEAHGELAARAVESVKEQIEEKIEALEEKIGAEEAASAVPPITNAWGRSWAKAEGKKQRVLMAALVSAFDPESYEAAMSHRFFALLDELDYPEIRHLVALTKAFRGANRTRPGRWSELDGDSYGDEGPTHRDRLAAHGLLIVKSPSQVAPTWLGLQLVAFLERGRYSGDDTRKTPTAEDEKA